MLRDISIVRSGSLTLIQDAGRPGLGHLAIPPSGALDRKSYKLANRLVGNDEGAAVLETTILGVEFRVNCECVVAITGALAPVEVDKMSSSWGTPIPLVRGQTINVGKATAGVRSYVAISGGIDVPPVFGSRSTDILSGIGPQPLHDGDVVPLGLRSQLAPAIDFAPYQIPQDKITLPLFLGPRHDWLTDESIVALSQQVWIVGSASNRIGIRLEGPPLERRRRGELASEGMVTGSLQVPSDGLSVIFMADHPTTGGYPVVGVISDDGLDLCAQARPGTEVSFHIRPSSWVD